MPFSLPGTVTQQNAALLEKEGLMGLATLHSVDCALLMDFDSSLLEVLLSWQKALQSKGERLTIVNAPEKLKILAGVYDVSELLGLA